jgi:hypothetical protein
VVTDEDTGAETEPEAPHTICCAICSRKLMGVAYPVVYQPETLGDLNLVHSSQEGAWCGHCRQVTVFVRQTEPDL